MKQRTAFEPGHGVTLSLTAFLLIAGMIASSNVAMSAATPIPHGGPATVSCHNLAGTKLHCKPDLTAGPSITVGGHVVPWGGDVALTAADALPQFRPYCDFNISYVLKNVGLGNAGPPATSAFRNVMYINAPFWVINRQSQLSLAASTDWTLHSAVNLLSGGNTLVLMIDAGNDVAESNELNNEFYITYHLTGNCKDLTSPPVTF